MPDTNKSNYIQDHKKNVTEMKRLWYERYYPLVKAELEKRNSKLHPTMVITQMAMESGWRDFSPTETNKTFTQSPFGVKKWKKGQASNSLGTYEEDASGKKTNQDADFAIYKTANEAINDYLDFIDDNKNYKKAYLQSDPAEQIKTLKKEKYATAVDYVDNITAQMKRDKEFIKDIDNNLAKDPNTYESAWKNTDIPKENKTYTEIVAEGKPVSGMNNGGTTISASTPGTLSQEPTQNNQGSINTQGVQTNNNTIPASTQGAESKEVPRNEIGLLNYKYEDGSYVTEIKFPNGSVDFVYSGKPMVQKEIYGEQYLVDADGKKAIRVSEQRSGEPGLKYVKTNEIAPLTKDGKSKMYPSVMITEGANKGRYKTTVNNGDGRMTQIVSKKPLEEKVVYGDKLYSEVGTDNSYSLEKKDADNSWNLKTLNDKNLAKDKLAQLEKKAKTKEGLTDEEMMYAKKAFDVRKMELETEKVKARGTEGYIQDSFEKGVRNSRAIGDEIDGLKNNFYNNIAVPELKRRQKVSVKEKDYAIKQAREDYTEGKITIEQLNSYQKNYDDFVKKDKEISNSTTKLFEKTNDNPGALSGVRYEDYINKALNEVGAYKPNASTSTAKNISTATKPTSTIPVIKGTGANAGSSSSASGTAGGATATVSTEAGKGVNDPDPSGMLAEEAKTKPELAAYLDEDYLIKQNKLDQETIDFIKSQKEFKAELPEEAYDYNNLLGNIADVGKGIIGVAGAMQEVPEYQRGDMFKESMDDARRMKDMGLSEQEKGLMKQGSERAYGFAVANLRGLSGGSAAAALGASGEAQRTLQDNYSKMTALDQGVRRQNRAAFVQAAIQDEQTNRQIFDDKMNQVLANKKEGAALARDAYTNMNERAQFNQQYGKGSQYQQYMNEQILSQRQATQALSQSQAFQKQQSIQDLEGNILDNNAAIKKQREQQGK